MIRKLFFFAVLLTLGALTANAQPGMMPPKIPQDTAVRVGVLENGLTYYIRHNAKPEGQGDFYIVHDVGAIQEEDSQIGLAHFLEHMAFNGTKNLPDNMLREYLESIGVKFGANLNAGTSQEATIYNIASVPLRREGIIDTALLILHDWSHFITLDPEEVDAERGVIVEELRTGNTAGYRVYMETMETLYNGSRYSYRNIIGEENHLRTFPHQDLVDFYHRWYRPDLQAVVLVGDFDVDEMEAKLIKVMADIPAVVDGEEKVEFKIPDNKEPLIKVATDPELTTSSVSYYIKHEPLPKELNDTQLAAALNTMNSAIATMGNYRLMEIAEKPNAPFMNANFAVGGITSTCDVFFANASAKNGELPSAFKALMTEVERIRQYGFTEGELERVKTEFMKRAEDTYEERFDKRTFRYVREYISNFRNNSAIPNADDKWQLDSAIIASMELASINAYATMYLMDENEVIIAQSPAKEDIYVPDSAEIESILASVKSSEIEPPAGDVERVPLIDKELVAGEVVKSEEGQFGSTIWTLSNGVKVILKPTDLKANEIVGSMKAEGGFSMFDDEDYISATYLPVFMNYAGVDKFSRTELSKQLAGKSASYNPRFGRNSTGSFLSSTTKDFETLMQLTYLYFTSPRFNRDDFGVAMDQMVNQITNAEKNPMFIFQKEFTNTLYGGNPRNQSWDLERLKEVDFNKFERIYNELLSSADDYTFTFVGDFDLETVKPLIELYIGSIPAAPSKLSKVDDGVKMAEGVVDKRFQTQMETPKSTVAYVYSGDMEYNNENHMVMAALRQALSSRYLQSIREEKGGTYGVSVSGGLMNYPKEQYIVIINFDTDPELVDELLEIVVAEIEKIAKEGPLAEDLNKYVEYVSKQHPADLKENNTWLGYLEQYYIDNIDRYSDFDEIFKNLNSEKVQEMAAKIIKDNNLVKVVMLPQE